MAERVVERAVALRLAREVLAGLEVAPADLMKVADWLLALPVPVTDVVDARARFVREMVQAGVVRLKRTGPEVAGD